MSWNRENVMWQSPDGSWNRGYWAVDYVDPNGDPEWDVEYSRDRFEELHRGLPSFDAAERIDWKQGGGVVEFTPKTEAQVERLEAAAKRR